MKLAKFFDLVSFRHLLILSMRKLACFMITFPLLLFIGTMTCLHNSSLVVILILGLTMFDLQMMLLISPIFLENRVRTKFLIQITFLTLIFEAYVYYFLLDDFIGLLVFVFDVTEIVRGLDLEMLGTIIEFLIKHKETH